MRRLFKRRKLLFGIVGVFLLGGVALAVIIGQARINQNTAETGPVSAPVVLAVGFVPDNNSTCLDANFEVVSSIQAFQNATLNLTSTVAANAQGTVCVLNNSSSFLTVFATTENVVSGELPGCPDANELAAGDQTCDNVSGELGGGELLIAYLAQSGTGLADPGIQGFCSSPQSTSLVEGGASDPIAALEPGGYCSYNILLETNPNIVDYSASSTDTIQFDIVFNGDDGT